MKRTEARELAVMLGFSLAVNGYTAQEALEAFFDEEHYAGLAGECSLFGEAPDDAQRPYIRRLVELIAEHKADADAYIGKYARAWKPERISKTAAAILRCAICEILYMDEIPNATAINEAVELAKHYDDAAVVSFVNGVLGGFVRGEGIERD